MAAAPEKPKRCRLGCVTALLDQVGWERAVQEQENASDIARDAAQKAQKKLGVGPVDDNGGGNSPIHRDRVRSAQPRRRAHHQTSGTQATVVSASG